jgi:DNA topoisomerase-1
MTPAVSDTVTVELRAGEPHAFRANGSVLIEPGFLAAYNIKADDPNDKDEDDEDDKRLPAMVEGEHIKLLEVIADQHFTEPPPRYTEASLVKTLEEFDIGRPSTYASIISTLQSREYVRLEGKAFNPTDVGMIVNRFLTDHFRQYVDYEFTANLEEELDEISRGEREWVPVLESFWVPFKARVDEKQELSRKEAVADARVIGVDPVSGKPVTARLGRYGPFVQVGTKEDVDKPRFASLRANQRIDTITLEAAMDLFKLPRKLGALPTGEEVETNIGRFGPYVRYGKAFVSLKKDDDPFTIELPRAIELIEQKACGPDRGHDQGIPRHRHPHHQGAVRAVYHRRRAAGQHPACPRPGRPVGAGLRVLPARSCAETQAGRQGQGARARRRRRRLRTTKQRPKPPKPQRRKRRRPRKR